MAKKKRSGGSEAAALWFKRAFAPVLEQIEGSWVEVRVFKDDRPHARLWTQSAQEYADFVAEFSDGEMKTAVYHGVALRDDKGGEKQNVLGTGMLWAEIDTGKLGWDKEECAKLLHNLSYETRPSACVDSGNGLHLYWLIDGVMPDQRQVEDANRALQEFVSGDNIWNVDRILRVPGSFNRKHDKKREVAVLWCYYWHTFDPSELVDAVLSSPTVLYDTDWISRERAAKHIADAKALSPETAGAIAHEDRRKERNARGVAIWDKCQYGGGPGRVGIDEAIMFYTAWRWCRLDILKQTEEAKETIVRDTLAYVKKVHARDARGEQWDWEAERRAIRRKLDKWAVKWSGLAKARNGKKERRSGRA